MKTASTANSEACAANPSGPGCSQSAADKTAQQNADALAKLSDANSAKPEYNVNDISGTNGSPNLGGGSGQNNGSGPAIKTIANNTGGGIPGGAGGVAGAKSGGILGGNGGGGLFGGNSSGVADIDRGLRSGGYTTTPGAEEEKLDESNGFSGYGNGRDPASTPDGKPGLDLKQYLPGGRLAADTRRAAAMQWQQMGIHPSHIDLWTRISEKIQQKCRLGELYDCR